MPRFSRKKKFIESSALTVARNAGVPIENNAECNELSFRACDFDALGWLSFDAIRYLSRRDHGALDRLQELAVGVRVAPGRAVFQQFRTRLFVESLAEFFGHDFLCNGVVAIAERPFSIDAGRVRHIARLPRRAKVRQALRVDCALCHSRAPFGTDRVIGSRTDFTTDNPLLPVAISPETGDVSGW